MEQFVLTSSFKSFPSVIGPLNAFKSLEIVRYCCKNLQMFNMQRVKETWASGCEM